MPAAAVGDLGQRRAAGPPRPSEPVTSATRVPLGSPSSSPARPSAPEQVARCCGSAGRRAPRSGASSAACPPASTTCSMARSAHQRLAGADLALQQPVHRMRPGQVGGDLLADRRAGPRSARTAARRRTRPAARPRRGGRARAGHARPRGPCAARASAGRRTPRPTSAGTWRRYSVLLASSAGGSRAARCRCRPGCGSARTVPGSGSSGGWKRVQHRPHAPGDHPGRHRRGGRVDRDQRAGELLDLLGRLVLRRVRPSSTYAGPLSCRLPRNSVTLPANSPHRPGRRSRSRQAWLKNVQVSVAAGAVADGDLQHVAAAGPHRPDASPTCTWASTVTCSPTSSARMSVCSPRSS